MEGLNSKLSSVLQLFSLNTASCMTEEQGTLHVPAAGHLDVFHKFLVESMTVSCNMYEFIMPGMYLHSPIRFYEESLNL
jgi:hypothetical protein